jgi:hypothetical protein
LGKEVGNPGQVGEQPVSVQPHEGQELVEHLEINKDDSDKEQLVPRGDGEYDETEREEEMEVIPRGPCARAPNAEAITISDIV